MNQKKSALLVIDLQVAPLYGTHNKEKVLDIIKELIARAEENQVPIFYVQHEEEAGGFLERGTPFWQLVDGISPRLFDTTIYKKSTDAFFETPLQQDLKSLGVNHLVVVGARTEYCVDTTCRRAVTLGFDVTLAADGHTTGDGAIPADFIIKHHNHNLSTVKTIHNQIKVIPSEDVTFE